MNHRRGDDPGPGHRRSHVPGWRDDDWYDTTERADESAWRAHGRDAPAGEDPAGAGGDRPWDEHRGHVPHEFEQSSRRADFRRRGEHENDAGRYGREPHWPESSPRRRMQPARGEDPRSPRAPRRGPDPGPREHYSGPTSYADTSGYDDYESEALYGTAYEGGDWPRTFRGAAAGPDGPDHRGRGPRDYRRSDERLLDDVCQRLSDDPDVDARELSVSCENGVVRIEGDVPERWVKHHVEHIVARCFGLRDIDNRIRVRRTDPHG